MNRYEDTIACRFELTPSGEMADVYAQVGSDEEWIGDVALEFLEKNGVYITSSVDSDDWYWCVSVPVKLVDEIRRQSARGWED